MKATIVILLILAAVIALGLVYFVTRRDNYVQRKNRRPDKASSEGRI